MTCPSGKVPHATYADALEHQKKLVWKNHLSGESERSKGLNVYPCSFKECGAWHVGHSDPIPLVYHYTIGGHLDKIIESGALKPRNSRKVSRAINEPNPLLWFSRNTVWEHSVLKDPRPLDRRKNAPTGRAITELAGQGLLRFGALSSVARLRWNDYLDRNDTPLIQREAMAQYGNPVDWLATDQDVLVSDCRSLEVWFNGCWTDASTIEDGAFENYLEGRMTAYNEAGKRLQTKIDAGATLDTVVVEDDAEAILVEDFKVERRGQAWLKQHEQEILKFKATLKPQLVRRKKRRR